MYIYLIRHCSTPQNEGGSIAGDKDDVALSDLGRKQAADLKERLANKIDPHRIYTSSAKRCEETAGIIFPDKLPLFEKLPVLSEIDKGFDNFLSKRPDESDLTPFEWEKKYNSSNDLKERANFRYPSGTTIECFMNDVINGFTSNIEKTKGDIAIVSHNGPIKALLVWAMGGAKENYFRLDVQQGKYCAIQIDKGKPKIQGLNL